MRILGWVIGLALATPVGLASQSEPDTVVAHAVYAGRPLQALLHGVASLAQGAFLPDEAERIHQQAWDLTSALRSYPPRPIERSYAYKVRGRDRNRSAVLAIYLQSITSDLFDVRIQTSDDALMRAIRAHLAELEIDSLIPVDRVRLAVQEERPPGIQPHVVLTMETAGTFPCLGYHIDHDLRQGYDTIYLNLHGVAAPPSPCPAAVGPARMARELGVWSRKYVLLVNYRGTTDRLLLEVSPWATVLKTIESSMVEADEQIRWRYPPRSFAFHCANVEVARPICDDVERWLVQRGGISRLSFPAGGVNPYVPDPEGRRDERTTFFRYGDESLFERLRPCFQAIEEKIREAVGVTLTLENWKGVSMTAMSTRSYDQRHIETPHRIPQTVVCWPPSPGDLMDASPWTR